MQTPVDKTKFCEHWDSRHAFQNKGKCRANLIARDVTGGPGAGWLLRSPCTNKNEAENKCPAFLQLSKEEIAAQQAEMTEAFERTLELLKFSQELKKAHSRGDQFEEKCPRCAGVLHVAIAIYNGHIRMRCETENCVNVME